MKRISFLSIILVLFISSSVQAHQWATMFVVWKGKVYNADHIVNENGIEVKQELILDEGEIGKVIGEVKTKANNNTGEYHGDASNYYRIGTKYYKIIGTPTSSAIAIKEGDKWVKAVYAFEAQKNFSRPLTIRELFKNFYFNSAVVIIALIIVGYIFQSKKSKKTNDKIETNSL
ncbi:MAG: hypothetical protein K0R18_2879 [Bacillales bacterium]|jgi:hypothetical protein|nr:hypothetical protein [Bacillales bacterium]